jgi:acyl-CoA reductase-like NAD-dependent aldehyde dehydrogenase
MNDKGERMSFEAINPANGEKLAEVPAWDESAIDNALEQAIEVALSPNVAISCVKRHRFCATTRKSMPA